MHQIPLKYFSNTKEATDEKLSDIYCTVYSTQDHRLPRVHHSGFGAPWMGCQPTKGPKRTLTHSHSRAANQPTMHVFGLGGKVEYPEVSLRHGYIGQRQESDPQSQRHTKPLCPMSCA